MLTFLPLILLIFSFGICGSQKKYKPSSRTTQKQIGRVVRVDSREYFIPDDQPGKPSKNRKVHPSVTFSKPTSLEVPSPDSPPTPYPKRAPIYRQESTVGFEDQDWRAVRPPVELVGGGGGTQGSVTNLDMHVRGMQRLEGRPSCCERKEGQSRPSWFVFLFGCCGGRR